MYKKENHNNFTDAQYYNLLFLVASNEWCTIFYDLLFFTLEWRPIWQPISSNFLSILNILTHFFTHAYIKNIQTTLFKILYQTPRDFLFHGLREKKKKGGGGFLKVSYMKHPWVHDTDSHQSRNTPSPYLHSAPNIDNLCPPLLFSLSLSQIIALEEDEPKLFTKTI